MREDRRGKLPFPFITGLDQAGFEILKILLIEWRNHSPELRLYTHTIKKQRLCPALSAEGLEQSRRGHKKLVDFCYHNPWEEILGGLTGRGWHYG